MLEKGLSMMFKLQEFRSRWRSGTSTSVLRVVLGSRHDFRSPEHELHSGTVALEPSCF